VNIEEMINVVVEDFIAFLTSACLLHVVLRSLEFWNYQRSTYTKELFINHEGLLFTSIHSMQLV
jgi:hypothetical protein